MPRFGLPGSARIKKREEFLAIQDNGRKLHSKLLVLFVRTRTGGSRIGITVSKRVHKDSTQRNRVRRKLREIFRLHRHLLSAPHDIVVIAKHESTTATYAELQSCFLKLLQAAKVTSEV